MMTRHLEQAKNRSEVFEQFLQMEIEQGANSEQLAFLDRGIGNSPYRDELQNYSTSLKRKPLNYQPYPQLGQIPPLYSDSLEFLHEDILEACICLGQFVDGELHSLWLGKNPLRKAQFWSSTKIIPILNIICQVNHLDPDSCLENWMIQAPEHPETQIPFPQIVADIINYGQKIGSSNALSAMCKRFESRQGLEEWWQKITGNFDLEFKGGYGEDAFIANPELLDTSQQKILLKAVEDTEPGENLVTAYDLTRIFALVGWHYHLPTACQLPHLNWESLKSIIPAMGQGTARYADVALEMLGLHNVIHSPVILSKMGHGPSKLRQTIETVYSAFIQFVDPLPKQQGQPPQLRSIAMTLRGAIAVENMDDYTEESIELDARMAAEVTEILRRLVTDELDQLGS